MKLDLKPDSRKILFSLLIVFVFVPFINYDNGMRCIEPDFIINPWCSSESIASPLIYFLQKFPPINEINVPVLLIGSALSYLLVSLLIGSKVIGFGKD